MHIFLHCYHQKNNIWNNNNNTDEECQGYNLSKRRKKNFPTSKDNYFSSEWHIDNEFTFNTMFIFDNIFIKFRKICQSIIETRSKFMLARCQFLVGLVR